MSDQKEQKIIRLDERKGIKKGGINAGPTVPRPNVSPPSPKPATQQSKPK